MHPSWVVTSWVVTSLAVTSWEELHSQVGAFHNLGEACLVVACSLEEASTAEEGSIRVLRRVVVLAYFYYLNYYK